MGIKKYHSLPLGVYFICALTVTVFSSDPYIIILSLIGGMLNLWSVGGIKRGGVLLVPLALFVLSALANPLFSHRGETELLFINGAAITLEAIISGAVTGAIFAAATLICASLSIVFDDARLFSLLSGAPKIALVLCGALRFFPSLMRRHSQIRDAQRGVGRLPDGRPIERMRATLSVWSALPGLAFEDAAQQARLIAVSGFDPDGKRRVAKDESFCRRDLELLVISLLLFAAALLPTALGYCETVFYPTFSVARGLECLPGYAAAALLFCLPTIINLKWRLKWLYLKSKI